jgi:hypothetical protein
MSLPPLKFMLECQLARCEQDFHIALRFTDKRDKSVRRHHLEGALSDAWQSYCGFVRYVLIRSSLGTVTSAGTMLAPSVTPTKWERVSHIGLRAANGNAAQPGVVNHILRKEPTWGDSSKIVNIVNALAPSNAATLKANFAGGLLGPKHCQIVRNACAHKNTQTSAEVSGLASQYIASPIRDPTDAMTWRVSGTQEFAFLAWIDDMKAIAGGVV